MVSNVQDIKIIRCLNLSFPHLVKEVVGVENKAIGRTES